MFGYRCCFGCVCVCFPCFVIGDATFLLHLVTFVSWFFNLLFLRQMVVFMLPGGGQFAGCLPKTRDAIRKNFPGATCATQSWANGSNGSMHGGTMSMRYLRSSKTGQIHCTINTEAMTQFVSEGLVWWFHIFYVFTYWTSRFFKSGLTIWIQRHMSQGWNSFCTWHILVLETRRISTCHFFMQVAVFQILCSRFVACIYASRQRADGCGEDLRMVTLMGNHQ